MSEINGVKNLLNLSLEEKKCFLKSFDYILTDCDGVIWHLTKPIEGVDIAVKALKDFGKQIVYVSNNSVRSPEQYLEKFRESGISVDLGDLIHPATATVHLLKKLNVNGLIYVIGSNSFKKIICDAGYEVVDGPNLDMEDSFKTFLKLTIDSLPVKAVVIDTDFNCSSAKLSRAENYLKNPDCYFIVGTTDMKLAITQTFQIIGPGPFYKLVSEFNGRQPYIIGKPGNELKDLIIDKYNLKGKKVLFVGDMLEQDISFGKLCNFQTLLVLNGGTTAKMLENHKIEHEIPNYYIDSFADLHKIIEEVTKC